MIISKKRAQEMEDEDLKLQLERNKDFIATEEDRGSKIFLTLENAKKAITKSTSFRKVQSSPSQTLHNKLQ